MPWIRHSFTSLRTLFTRCWAFCSGVCASTCIVMKHWELMEIIEGAWSIEQNHGKLKTSGLSWFALLLLIFLLTLSGLTLLHRSHGTCQLFASTFPCEVWQLQLGIGIQDSTSLGRSDGEPRKSRSEQCSKTLFCIKREGFWTLLMCQTFTWIHWNVHIYIYIDTYVYIYIYK